MPEMIYKSVEKADEAQVRKLITDVLATTPPEFFIPYEEWELTSLFDKTYAFLFGAYDENRLAGIAQLYTNQDMLKEYKKAVGLPDENICEFGGCMVYKEYRGRKIQHELLKFRCELARKLGFKYAITMAHPDNMASKKNIEKTGFNFVKKTTLNNGFLRNLYRFDLSET